MTWPGPRDAYLAQKAAIDEAVQRVLDSGTYVLGPEVEAFEAEFAAFIGVEQAVGVASGTDALVVALRSLGIRAGDRVATVSHTAVATVAAVEMVGAQPVLVDVDDASMTMDPASLERTLAAVGGVHAVIPVHLYGHPADVPAIRKIAARWDAVVIEDCSQAHGAVLDGRHVGTLADAATFSCYPTKNLGALGDAGIVTASAEVAQRARRVRQYGWIERYVSAEIGVNSRLDPLQAAVLRIRLRQLGDDNAARRRVAAIYDAQLAGLVRTPPVSDRAIHVYHQYVVRAALRDSLRDALMASDIPTAVLYPLAVHQQPAYAGRVAMDPKGLHVTERVCRELLCLPMHPRLAGGQVGRVVAAVRSWQGSTQ